MKQDDWRLFREKLPIWQEAYMDRLNKKYIELLSGGGNPSEKFWALYMCMKEDKHSPGVQLEMQKSDLIMNIIALLHHGVIQFDHLQAFSDDLKTRVAILMEV